MAIKKDAAKHSHRKTESAAPILNYDPVIVKKVQEQMLEEKQLSAVSEFFKVLGDETRMKIINALSHGELCVSDIAAALGMTQSAVSHQLKLLRMAKEKASTIPWTISTSSTFWKKPSPIFATKSAKRIKGGTS